MTRQASARALQHLYDNVLNVNLRDPVRYILDHLGVQTLHDFLGVDVSYITPELRVEVPIDPESDDAPAEGEDMPTTTVSLSLVACSQLKQLITWIKEHDYDTDEALNLTSDDFLTWRIARTTPNPTPQPGTTGPLIATTPRNVAPTDLSTNFTKTIKRSADTFKEFKDDRMWLTWIQSTTIQATAQGLQNLFNSTYVPSTDDEKRLHDAQNAYLFSVLDQKVLTTRGRVILRKHATTLRLTGTFCPKHVIWS